MGGRGITELTVLFVHPLPPRRAAVLPGLCPQSEPRPAWPMERVRKERSVPLYPSHPCVTGLCPGVERAGGGGGRYRPGRALSTQPPSARRRDEANRVPPIPATQGSELYHHLVPLSQRAEFSLR